MNQDSRRKLQQQLCWHAYLCVIVAYDSCIFPSSAGKIPFLFGLSSSETRGNPRSHISGKLRLINLRVEFFFSLDMVIVGS